MMSLMQWTGNVLWECEMMKIPVDLDTIEN